MKDSRSLLLNVFLLVVALTSPARGQDWDKPDGVRIRPSREAMVQGDSTDLVGFLKSIETAMRPTTNVRADGTITIASPEKTTRDQLTILRNTAGDQYVETKSGTRALMLKNGGESWIVTKETKKATVFARDAVFMGSDFTREDMQPFVADRYDHVRIADESPQQYTLTLMPRDSQYILLVTTFDREQQYPVKSLYYVKTMSNLVKLRRDTDLVKIGSQWLPSQIIFEDLPLRTRTILNLKWTADAAIPSDLFKKEGLEKPSPLKFQ